ncbi:MAG: D-2-hydroxyacid dehydrogenase [Hyphomicrobiales bacterium]|nr:D-2-hydroxyacid dehydrogenase [Hyphomicrobiales bacterium]
MTIVFLDRETLPPQTRLRPPDFPHRMIAHQRSGPHEVADRIADADIVISNKVPIRAAAIAAARRLRFIAIAATGTDMVDLDACAERGIVVSNVRNYAGVTVPEHTFALIFALRRSLFAYHDSVRRGRWQTASQFCFLDHPIEDLAGSTIGIVGGGSLGNAVGSLARALGMNVLVAGRKGAPAESDRTPFEDVLRQSDVISLHVPLTPETTGLIGAPEFALMDRKPILINTARGGLVDEVALDAALAEGRISGAGFDVASVEPPAADHPLMGLSKYPNFILTPHVAWASRGGIQALADQTIDNIEAFQRGGARNVVTG